MYSDMYGMRKEAAAINRLMMKWLRSKGVNSMAEATPAMLRKAQKAANRQARRRIKNLQMARLTGNRNVNLYALQAAKDSANVFSLRNQQKIQQLIADGMDPKKAFKTVFDRADGYAKAGFGNYQGGVTGVLSRHKAMMDSGLIDNATRDAWLKRVGKYAPNEKFRLPALRYSRYGHGARGANRLRDDLQMMVKEGVPGKASKHQLMGGATGFVDQQAQAATEEAMKQKSWFRRHPWLTAGGIGIMGYNALANRAPEPQAAPQMNMGMMPPPPMSGYGYGYGYGPMPMQMYGY